AGGGRQGKLDEMTRGGRAYLIERTLAGLEQSLVGARLHTQGGGKPIRMDQATWMPMSKRMDVDGGKRM
ncbi:MAG: hypothetical protein KGO05_11505, partial [Chloroflexota bacterium]|nr:hypothetical protein [Chloroflexota bacterium]